MSSSTSNSRNELKALAVPLVALLCVEIAVRCTLPTVSMDLAMIDRFDEQALALAKAEGPRIATFGNSLMVNGIKPDAFADELKQQGHGPIAIQNFALHASTNTEWWLVYQRFLEESNQLPDAALIGLSPAPYEGRAEEAGDYRMGWVSMECTPREFLWVLTDRMHSFEDKGRFAQGFVFKSTAGRSPIRTDRLIGLIPDYWPAWVKMNKILKQRRNKIREKSLAKAARQNKPVEAPKPPKPPDYHVLQRFADRAKSRGVLPVLVLMPIDGYDTANDVHIQAFAKKQNIVILDARVIPGLTTDDFEPDGWHLHPSGGEKFSRFLARKLPGLLAK